MNTTRFNPMFLSVLVLLAACEHREPTSKVSKADVLSAETKKQPPTKALNQETLLTSGVGAAAMGATPSDATNRTSDSDRPAAMRRSFGSAFEDAKSKNTSQKPESVDAMTKTKSKKPESVDATTKTKSTADKKDILGDKDPEANAFEDGAATKYLAMVSDANADGVSLRRLIMAPAVEHREPVAEASSFPSTGAPIYAFMDLKNEGEEERELTVHFIGPQGGVRGGVTVSVPPKVARWRTWAFTKRARTVGTWRTEVRAEDGELVGTLEFDVK